jgi:photosystem II stability/assembly factor-like uncharacterized protein
VKAKRKSVPILQPVQFDTNKDKEIEDVKGREDWFLFQRRYPFDSIPEDARRLAWESRLVDTATPEVAWQPIGPAPTTSAFPNNWGVTSGRINTVAVSPANPQLVLVGGATGGIWRSTDGGVNFAGTSDNQTDLAVQSIAFSQSNPTIVYAGMGDSDAGYLGTGVLKSTDSGQTWTRVNNSTLPSPGLSAKIEVDPTNSNRVYLGQYAQLGASGGFFSSGFYFSTDGGVNWTGTLVGLPRDLVLNPANSQTLYLAMSRVDDGVNLPGLYRSTNGGSNWTRIYTTPYDANRTSDVAVAVTPANSQVIYVYTGGSINNVFETRVEISTNGGSTWTNRGSGTLDRAQFGYNTYIYADPSNADTVYAGTRDVFKSTNAGVSWTNLNNNFDVAGNYTPGSSNTHPDQHAFAFQPGSPSTAYIGNDGGIWRTTNGGTTFSNLNSSLSFTMFVSYALHPTNAAISYGGTQDNGSQKRLASPGQWREFISGDGGNCVIDAVTPTTVFSTYVFGTIFRFTNNGDTFEQTVGTNATFGEPNTNPRIAFYPPFTGNGVNSNLYFGTWRLFTSTNLGNNWTPPAGTLDLTKGITANGPDVLSAIGVSRSNTNFIYTGSAQGRAMVSTNGGTSWTDITAGLPDRFIKSITVSPTNPATAYLTLSGFRSGHVFRTTNTGGTWTDISGNLPDIPTNALLIDPLNANTIYLGTDIGIFRTTTGGNTWASFNSGLPPVIVNSVAAQSSGLIQAATYGRGAYELGSAVLGTQTIGLFRPGGNFFYLRNSNTTGFPDITVPFGAPGDIPVVGDWDGNGTMTIGLYRPSTSTFYLRNSNTIGFPDVSVSFGDGPGGDLPIVGDWNGDGVWTIGVYRPSTSTFYLRNSNTIGFPDLSIPFGAVGDLPIVGDWNGDGTTTIGLYRPVGSIFYLRNSNTVGFPDITVGYGASGDMPIVGDWDGNGTVTIGVYRASGSIFYLRNSNTTGFPDLSIPFGAAGDKPLAGNWDGL